jgi:DNA-binding transcriptional ArsR family regulator
MFKDLDPLLHSQVRLAIMSILLSVKKAEFGYLLDNIKTTKGNLSFQLGKLNEADYIQIEKSSKGNYPLTLCHITDKGIEAYKRYVNCISGYFAKSKNNDNN